MLVFCVKFRLSPVCQYQNYYYNITNNYLVILEQIQRRECWGYTFLKRKPWIFKFVPLTLELIDKRKFYPWKIWKSVSHCLEVPRLKTKAHGNSTWFLLDHPCKFHVFFNWSLAFGHKNFSYPWEFHILKPPAWIFLCNSPLEFIYLSIYLFSINICICFVLELKVHQV